MLALAPGSVRLDVAEKGDIRPISQILPALHEHGVLAVSPNGVLGDPAGASEAEGERLLAELTQVGSWPPRVARELALASRSG